jgi:HlyD family secretion protein
MEKIKTIIMRLGLPLAAVVVLYFALSKASTDSALATKKPEAEPSTIPAGSLFENQVAGIGIIEPRSEKISIGTEIAGIVKAVPHEVGARVKKGDVLFEIDTESLQSELAAARSAASSAKVALEDAKNELGLYESVADKNAISKNELQRKRYGAKLAKARLAEAEANIKVLQTSINRSKIKSPIDANILRINVRPGEFAQAGALNTPLMIIGDIDTMHVRVEIDETEANKVESNAAAKGFLRGTTTPITLQFVRKEPFVMPKKSFTGDGNERVDTRVMEVIYSFDNTQIGSSVGQQMDVYIESR